MLPANVGAAVGLQVVDRLLRDPDALGDAVPLDQQLGRPVAAST
jgi:hypothetical protein